MSHDEKSEAMTWDRLLSEDGYDVRPKGEERQWRKKIELSQPEDDYQRVVTSSLVRALQDKTQMFSMDSSAQVRTRLTHSIEVSAVARRFVPAVSNILTGFSVNSEDRKGKHYKRGHFLKGYFVDKSDIDGYKKIDAMQRTLETAGLLHDLGNPPFGHDGEKCLSEQVRTWCDGHSELLTPDEIKDLGNVEGNSQALRFLIHPNPAMDIALVQPTYALLATMTKYTVCSKDWQEEYKDSDVVWRHKPGYYLSEREACEDMGAKLGLIQSEAEPHECCRHPLAYLLEASDDIAYLTADLEDAYARKLVKDEDIADMWGQLAPLYEENEKDGKKNLNGCMRNVKELAETLRKYGDNDFDEKLLYIHKWIFLMRNSLVYGAAHEFSYRLDEIMKGSHHDELLKDSKLPGPVVTVLKKAMEDKVYPDAEIVRQRKVGTDALGFIFKRFVSCIDDATGEIVLTENVHIPRTLESYLENTKRETDSHDKRSPAYHALRTVLDYLCSLTDRRVLELSEIYRTYTYDRLEDM